MIAEGDNPIAVDERPPLNETQISVLREIRSQKAVPVRGHPFFGNTILSLRRRGLIKIVSGDHDQFTLTEWGYKCMKGR